MRMMVAALFCLSVAGCATAPGKASASSCSNPAIDDMRSRFEAAVLSMENKYAEDPEGLRDAAIPVALSIYGADWGVLRAHAECSLASLPEIDLAAYATVTPLQSPFSDDLGESMQSIMPFMNPGGLAMMRFWDAEAVGFMTAPMVAAFTMEDTSANMLGTKMMLVPGRVWRGAFNGRDVIATRYMRSVVIFPYTINEQGMVMPAFDLLKVYPLQL